VQPRLKEAKNVLYSNTKVLTEVSQNSFPQLICLFLKIARFPGLA